MSSSPEISIPIEQFEKTRNFVIQEFEASRKSYGDSGMIGTVQPILGYFEDKGNLLKVPIIGIKTPTTVITNECPYPDLISVWRGVELFKSLQFVNQNTLTLCTQIYNPKFDTLFKLRAIVRQHLNSKKAENLQAFTTKFNEVRKLFDLFNRVRTQYPDATDFARWMDTYTNLGIIVNCESLYQDIYDLPDVFHQSTQVRNSVFAQKSLRRSL
jgi:hypothetical protein